MTKNDLDDTVTLFYYDTNMLVGILVLAFPEPGLAGPLRGRFWHDSKDLLSEPGVLYLAIRSLSGRLGFPGHIKQIVGRSRSLTRTDSIAWRRSISVSYDTGRCRLAGDPGSSTSSTSSTSSGTGRRQGRIRSTFRLKSRGSNDYSANKFVGLRILQRIEVYMFVFGKL
ncbi:hypothetical protein PCH_Pc22g20010 [Penicillium rubens Wisconsin 54-1255]|uniref:Uncharacterized protein n=1 Tax=Penicillium rubens (strain ATCC 28089 / DSM 1075 / NRRL 1951 / Wisconsin 54-1255) TaxID=500485 RepID=B6HQE3_PENRW|nr:hypothetical protein PCH_Pc22g20010 [Penicillium rubens Wisconsin 54-1255]